MFRFAFTSTLILLCIALSHGAPGLTRTQVCDEKSCNDTCTIESQASNDLDIYRGWCDPQGTCRCYHRDICHADSCKNTCEEKHMNETNLTYECKDNACICKWNRKMEETSAPDASMPADNVPNSEKREATIRVVDVDSFYMEKEIRLPVAKKAAQ
ncbi:uncharacterized protein LOC119397989 [Rhipicephalus sanguineus]|uniref:uncharacterized protein LOC119397989 n=1 Tax=Rhipicephalus sanguineus TaxID=34632 RepID=UPI0020C1EADB|nr:uncharacterized protein LOC119397989 [Rhipicephalus sanguineus]